ncbi:methyltransferase domain-containing protein [Synechococcus sp. CS-1332]|uniref:methyltransferase domain-containing protein n=1 Tax=Synechococcus sp. CS-1332 TaxID=2847972 RepID=UPI00223AB3C1|nr:methyltransferase domain-containing protein [Synechococcus sp. CS-1332]MCT0208228.1 methyltransferase domain-containing protein [Synechococcus sp. CS-1332]
MAPGSGPDGVWHARRQRTPARLTAPDPQAPAASNDTYVLGNDAVELDRLRLQHDLWRPTLRASLGRAGLSPGERVIDLGAGPGFVAQDLARIVGPAGRVLGLEQNPAYVRHGQQLAQDAGLGQLDMRCHDLLSDPLPAGPFDLVWCRWVAMFLPAVEPLLDPLPLCLTRGGRLLFHEYVHWDSFGLHPHGLAIARFSRAVQRSFRQAGSEPDISRRLPSLLAARGFTIEDLLPLPVVGRAGTWPARWLEMFVTLYGSKLQALGLWSMEEAEAARVEIEASRADPGSFWMGPTILEVRARWS